MKRYVKMISLCFSMLVILSTGTSLGREFKASTEITSEATSEIASEVTSEISSEIAVINESKLVEFADENMEMCVSNVLNIPVGSITEEDMLELSELYCYSARVSNIRGIEYAENLRALAITNGNITDISDLSSLVNLELLNLASNQISDISPLSELTNLQLLSVGNNNIQDISGLSNLTSLTKLNLADNNITDLSALANMQNLWLLSIANNGISDISGVSSLKGLELLEAPNNNISDLSPLSGLIHLAVLDLDSNNITDISSLNNVPKLGVLYISNNYIEDISSIVNINMLSFLQINNNQISDFSPIGQLEYSVVLDAADQNIALDSITISENQEIFTEIISVDGSKVKVSLTSPSKSGVNQLSGKFNLDLSSYNADSMISGTVTQTVTLNGRVEVPTTDKIADTVTTPVRTDKDSKVISKVLVKTGNYVGMEIILSTIFLLILVFLKKANKAIIQ